MGEWKALTEGIVSLSRSLVCWEAGTLTEILEMLDIVISIHCFGAIELNLRKKIGYFSVSIEEVV